MNKIKGFICIKPILTVSYIFGISKYCNSGYHKSHLNYTLVVQRYIACALGVSVITFRSNCESSYVQFINFMYKIMRVMKLFFSVFIQKITKLMNSYFNHDSSAVHIFTVSSVVPL